MLIFLFPITLNIQTLQTHGTIGEWKLQPGEAFGAGDVLCDIETDKGDIRLHMFFTLYISST